MKAKSVCDIYINQLMDFIDHSKWAKHLLRDYIKQHNESF